MNNEKSSHRASTSWLCVETFCKFVLAWKTKTNMSNTTKYFLTELKKKKIELNFSESKGSPKLGMFWRNGCTGRFTIPLCASLRSMEALFSHTPPYSILSTHQPNTQKGARQWHIIQLWEARPRLDKGNSPTNDKLTVLSKRKSIPYKRLWKTLT